MPFTVAVHLYRHVVAAMTAAILILAIITLYLVYTISNLYANQRELCKFVDKLEKQSLVVDELYRQRLRMYTFREGDVKP